MMRIKLARETGWTLDVIDELTMPDLWDLQSVFEGEAKANT